MAEKFLKSRNITVYYGKSLQHITKKNKEEMMISDGAPFLFILQSIFGTYPSIELRYPPGVLAFRVNGEPPNDFTTINDGDVLEFAVDMSDFDNMKKTNN